MRKRIAFLVVAIFLCILSSVSAGTNIDIQGKDNRYGVYVTSDDVESLEGFSGNGYIATFSFVPETKSGLPDMGMVTIINKETGKAEDLGKGLQAIVTSTPGILFKGNYPRAIYGVPQPTEGFGYILGFQAPDFNYLVDIFKLSEGSLSIIIGQEYIVDLDFDEIYFSMMIDACRLSNSLGVSFYDVSFEYPDEDETVSTTMLVQDHNISEQGESL